jgi:sugar phosphate isomerase/epimerase
VPAPISIQLYTLREEAAASGLHAVVERLGRIGYAGVEPAGFHELTPREFKLAVEDAGMAVSGAHVQLPEGSDANAVLDAQEEIGNRSLVVAFMPPARFADAGAIQKTADELNQANERVRARGMSLGYHNHYWEFENQVEGETAHAHLFRMLDPTVFAEVDTYWAQVGGADAAQVVAELGPRARLLHVKDGPADDPKAPMTAVGAGAMDVPAILCANDAVEWHVVELDRCATDMFEAVEGSYRYLVENSLSRGRV